MRHSKKKRSGETTRKSPVRSKVKKKKPQPSDDLWGKGDKLITKNIAPIKWIIDDILPEGLACFGAKPKAGKSLLVLAFCIAVSKGGKILGKKTRKGESFYLALEDSERRLQDRLEKMGHRKKEDLANFHYSLNWPQLDLGGYDALDHELETHPKARLIVIDTWGKICPPTKLGANVYQQDYKDLSRLQSLAMAHHVCILIVTHLRKAGADQEIDKISGSAAITGCADTIMIMNKPPQNSISDHTARLYFTGRDIDTQEMALKLQPETLTWTLLGDIREVFVSDELRDVIEVLHAKGEPMSPTDIAEVLEVKPSTMRVRLKRFFDRNQIRRWKGKYSPK